MLWSLLDKNHDTSLPQDGDRSPTAAIEQKDLKPAVYKKNKKNK